MDHPDQRAKVSNLLRLLAYVKPYWPHFAAATACGLIKLLTPAVVAWLVGQIINVLTSVKAGTMPPAEAWPAIVRYVLFGVGLVVVDPLFVYLRSALAARATQEVIRSLRCDLYAHIQKLSHSFFDANRSGSLTSRIIGDIEAIQPFIGKAFVQMWMSFGMIAVVLGYFFTQNVLLATLCLGPIALQLFVQRFISWRVKENAREIRDQLACLAGNTQEKLAASTVVKTFTGEDEEIQRFTEDSSALVDLGVRNAQLNGLSQALMHLNKSMATLLIIIVGGKIALFSPETISVGLLIQFIMIQGQLYTPFEWLNEMQIIIANAMGASERVFAIFDTEPEVADTPGAIKAPRFIGNISFEQVSFTYPDAERPVLTDLTLDIPACTTLALVGPSGGGKTTVTHLLNRFYAWEKGKIRVDGRDIRDYTIYSLRHQVGLVPQEPILFSGTIEDNILYGRSTATPEEVREAARKAYAHDFIEEQEEGYQTMLGERGVKLSGGQKQRIAIARAFLKDPAILILDEATSALDSESERIVQQALQELMKNRTTLVIAHRLSTIRNADQIAVVNYGKVVELGSHDELVAHGGLYARLCRQQFGKMVVTAQAS